MLGSMNALVTGSSKGLGKSIALALAQAGYDLIIHGRNKERLEEVKRKVEDYEAKCDIVRGDITLPGTIDRLSELATRKNLDVLVNNAATYLKKSFMSTTDQEIKAIININLISPMLLTRRIFPIFAAKNKGLILNINSTAGREPGGGEPVYCASKHGLRGFTSSLQFDATRHGVRIVDIYPGAMKTDMTKERGPADLFIEPGEVADLVIRLCRHYDSLQIKEITIGRCNY